MSNIVEKISNIPNLYKVNGAESIEISKAQKCLGVQFSTDYIDYLKQFCAISFWGTELTGLNISGPMNVVEATKEERRFNKDFPKGCFVLENIGIDNIIVVMNQDGFVFSVYRDKVRKICNSFSEYIDICLKRNQ